MGRLSKTLVVGLLPGQARKIADEFPEGLRFLPRQRERELGSLAGLFDTIVPMTKFISHSTFYGIPKEKLQPVKGGLTDLKRTLGKIVAALPPEPPKPQKAPAVVQAQVEVASESVMVETSDYSLLRAAQVGEEILLKKPRDVDDSKFERRVSVMRTYYKNNFGIETTVERQANGNILIQVTKIKKLRGEQAKKAVRTPKVEKPVAAVQPGDAAFWQQTVLAFINSNPGITADAAIKRAEQVMAAFGKRFPK